MLMSCHKTPHWALSSSNLPVGPFSSLWSLIKRPSPEQQASLKANHYFFFILLTESICWGQRGKSQGGRRLWPRWWGGEPEKSLFIAGECFDSGTKATSFLPGLKDVEIRAALKTRARDPNWMVWLIRCSTCPWALISAEERKVFDYYNQKENLNMLFLGLMPIFAYNLKI